MKKPSKRRPADVNRRMHGILADVIALSNKPIKAPVAPKRRRKS